MTKVWITTALEGFHCWPEAPESVSFLRQPHRHIFKIRAESEICLSRQIEFFQFKWAFNDFLVKTFPSQSFSTFGRHYDFGSMSCEQIAAKILQEFQSYELCEVSVSEDGENGATVTRNLG
jgi:hypothetical protein